MKNRWSPTMVRPAPFPPHIASTLPTRTKADVPHVQTEDIRRTWHELNEFAGTRHPILIENIQTNQFIRVLPGKTAMNTKSPYTKNHHSDTITPL